MPEAKEPCPLEADGAHRRRLVRKRPANSSPGPMSHWQTSRTSRAPRFCAAEAPSALAWAAGDERAAVCAATAAADNSTVAAASSLPPSFSSVEVVCPFPVADWSASWPLASWPCDVDWPWSADASALAWKVCGMEAKSPALFSSCRTVARLAAPGRPTAKRLAPAASRSRPASGPTAGSPQTASPTAQTTMRRRRRRIRRRQRRQIVQGQRQHAIAPLSVRRFSPRGRRARRGGCGEAPRRACPLRRAP